MSNLTPKKQLFRLGIILVLIALIGLAILMSLSTGYSNVTFSDVSRILLGGGSAKENLILYQFRLPRLVMAILVGMGLAASGCLLQSISRNDLADPGILGINVGAGMMVVLVYKYLPFISVHYPFALPIASFFGAFGVALLICWLSFNRYQGFSPMKMILMGIAISAAGNAFILVTSLKLDRATYVSFSTWNIGNIGGTTWDKILILLPWILILLPLAFFKSKELNTLALGKDLATSLGVNVGKQQIILLMIAVALAAAIVSVAGAIGFIGLIAPHIARRLVGASHEFLLPTTILVGALIVIVSDTLARTIFSPSELPVGIVITVVGAPYFLYLLRKNKN
ncbi:MAG: iron ABC transporter permease [Turicibacter sp.]|nr:iron ABC transporter permease [Turicibacter sp.]